MIPRSKATVNNAAMTGSVMQAPRPEQRDVDGSVVGSDGQEPHGFATKYEDANGCLAVVKNCGMCFTNVPRRDVLNGTANLACDIAHRKRDDATYDAIRNVATVTVKGGRQSQ